MVPVPVWLLLLLLRPAAASELSSKPAVSFQEPPLVIQPELEHYATVIFLHGLGDSGHGWAPLIPSIDAEIPGLAKRIRYILPHADKQKVSVDPNGTPIPAWFDIMRLSEEGPEDVEGLGVALQKVEAIIAEEVSAGTPAERIVLAGFSQGASLALHVALRTDYKLAGAVSLSGWLSLMNSYPEMLNPISGKGLRLLFGHGDADPIVKYEWGAKSFSILKELGLEARFATAYGADHGAVPSLLQEMSIFIGQVVCSARPSGARRRAAALGLPGVARRRLRQTAGAPAALPEPRLSPDSASTWRDPPAGSRNPPSRRLQMALAPALMTADVRNYDAAQWRPRRAAAGGAAGAVCQLQARSEGAWAQWHGQWRERLDQWWLALPPAAAGTLRGCATFMAGVLAARFESWLKLRNLPGAGLPNAGATPTRGTPAGADPTADPSCAVEHEHLSLPAFPELPSQPNEPSLWQLPLSLPRLLPRELPLAQHALVWHESPALLAQLAPHATTANAEPARKPQVSASLQGLQPHEVIEIRPSKEQIERAYARQRDPRSKVLSAMAAAGFGLAAAVGLALIAVVARRYRKNASSAAPASSLPPASVSFSGSPRISRNGSVREGSVRAGAVRGVASMDSTQSSSQHGGSAYNGGSAGWMSA